MSEQTTEIKLETFEDLTAFLRQLPQAERFKALKVIQRLKRGKIDHIQAAAEIKELFLSSGIYVEESESSEQCSDNDHH